MSLLTPPAFGNLVVAQFYCPPRPHQGNKSTVYSRKKTLLSESPPPVACAARVLLGAGNRVAFCGPPAADWLSAWGVPAAPAQLPGPSCLAGELNWQLGSPEQEERGFHSLPDWTHSSASGRVLPCRLSEQQRSSRPSS